MLKLIRILKSFIFPVTIFTILTLIGVIMTINAVYIMYANNSESAIYSAIIIPITISIIGLYILDRLLLKKISYIKLMIGEIVFIVITFFIFIYQSSTIDINFYTNEDYVLVLFDSHENSMSKFNKKRIFGKEYDVYDTNIIHLNSEISFRKDLRINVPKQWESFTQNRSIYEKDGDSIKYIFSRRNIMNMPYKIDNRYFIDSLINEVKLK
ncbi:hypothetical protein [Litoribaculum gwangyangense]|uniref:Uncharacterized protein n=1 Tax=Litoribaculum gwangyangense TaxID=1130722 RepID=A0ABP9CFL3_9FLAO